MGPTREETRSIGAAGYRHCYRAISIELEPAKNTAKGICIKKDIAAGGVLGKLSGHGGSERGQPIGSETMHVVAWLGPHETEGAADEKGFKFSWGDLREKVIDAVTSAGWTYKPKKV